MKTILITGSGGLIGYELSRHYLAEGWTVHGVDNDERGIIFGLDGSGKGKIAELAKSSNYRHWMLDISSSADMATLRIENCNAVVHCAAQPSHDQSGKDPLRDFQINALGTVHVLEWARHSCPDAPFVHMSSSKVYGDVVNQWHLRETPTRYDFDMTHRGMGVVLSGIKLEIEHRGVNELVSIDQSLHSPYGASKASSDLMAQEYARYYGMPVMVIRPTNMTGPAHSGVEAHGYLNYLVKCAVTGKPYTIFGYKGKQVRDNIHSDDVISFVSRLVEKPKTAEVYNLGSGKENARSIIETIVELDRLTGTPLNYTISDQPRKGDHIVYYTDIRKAMAHYPGWGITMPIQRTLETMVEAARSGL